MSPPRVPTFVEFAADVPVDEVRELGALKVPAGLAVASILASLLRAAGYRVSEPVVDNGAWTFSVAARRGSIRCSLVRRDHWYLALEALPGRWARTFGLRLDGDRLRLDAAVAAALASDRRFSDVRWYTKVEVDSRVTTIPVATLDELRAHGISEPFARFATSARRSFPELGYWCDEPVADWRYYVPPRIERPRQLWSTNTDPTVVALLEGTTAFVKLHHDDVHYEVVGRSEADLAKHLLQQVMEVEDFADGEARARLRRIADAMGYPHVDGLEVDG